MMTVTNRIGTIDWVDLMTPDDAAARRFYSAVLGWGYESTDTPAGTYYVAAVDGHQCAGIMAARPDGADGGPAPARWTVFIRVAALEETLAAVAMAGGAVLADPDEIPGGARVAVAADPTGAVFALISGGPEPGPDEPPLRRAEPGAVGWCELLSRDPHAAVGFYDAVFGWQAVLDHETGYTVFRLGGADVGGLLPMPQEVPAQAPSQWMVYFHVADPSEAASATASAGGSVDKAATTMGDMTFVVISDPAGATLGLLSTV